MLFPICYQLLCEVIRRLSFYIKVVYELSTSYTVFYILKEDQYINTLVRRRSNSSGGERKK